MLKIKTKMSMKQFGDITYLSNGLDEFKIEKNMYGEYIVYHKNYIKSKKGYHRHDKIFNSFEKAKRYCFNHRKQYFKERYSKNLKQINSINNIDRILNKTPQYIKVV